MYSSYIPARMILGARRTSSSRQRMLPFLLECFLGIAAVALVAAFARWYGWPTPILVPVFLLIVVPAALWGGFWQAVVVSLSALFMHAFFSAGYPWFHLASDPVNAVDLVSLIVVAFAVSRLAVLAKRHAREAESWSGQMHDLYEFTRRTLQMNLHVEPGPQLTELIHEIFALEAVAVFDADLHDVYQAGVWNVDPQEMARNVYYFGTTDDDPQTGLGRRVVRLGTVPIGSLIVRGKTSPLTNNAIASLIAITFDRYRAFANESRIENERRAEQLRATVLDSLAHAYKTPLTAIRAAGTGLVEMGHLSAGQADLVALINEQTSLLSDLTTRLLTTARLDSGEVVIHTAPVGIGSLIEEVLAGLKDRLANMKLAVNISQEDITLCCDRQLMIMLLTQYIDNACKYSILGATITIRAWVANGEAVFSVHSYGPVIPISDRERIFDRFYRSPAYSNRAPGTGIGLSVAKRVAQIHGGSVWLTSDEQEGTTFFAAIPAITGKGISE